MPVASEAVKHKRDETMLTGMSKAKCPCCGHEFIAMEGGFLPNAPVCCPKCGTVVRVKSILGMLWDVITAKKKNNI